MWVQDVIAQYIQIKLELMSPKGLAFEKQGRANEGKRHFTIEDKYAFVVDCQKAFRSMGKHGEILLKKYGGLYIVGFYAPINAEHRLVNSRAKKVFREMGLLNPEYYV